MAKLRKIQFYRNGAAQTADSHQDAINKFKIAEDGNNNLIIDGMFDGEILLYRYKIGTEGAVHTLVGVVHVSGTGESATHSLEVLANYDMLGGEISDAITTAINALDGGATIASVSDDGVVTLKTGIVQTDGIVDNITDDEEIELAKVATTGAAADVSVADTEEVIAASTVEGALVEIAKEIDAMDYNVSDEEGFTPTAQGEKVKVTIQQKDGKITNVDVDETALETALDELEAATTLEGVEAIKVEYSETVNTVSLKIKSDDKILDQDGTDGLFSTLSLTYDTTVQTDGKKYIRLKGKDNADISTIDATEFIKDGMLADAEIITANNEEGLTPGKRYIKFTFKTYQHGVEGEEVLKVEYLDVESLIDSYTSGDEWIVIDQTANTISHKVLFEEDQEKGSVTSDEAEAASEFVEFAVPTIKIDEAGHVIAISDNTVKVTLPATIATAVQTVTSTEAVNATNKFVAVHATRAEDSNVVVLTSELKTQGIASATDNNNGLATALDVRNYVDTNSTTVSGYTKTTGEGESAVSTVVTEVVSTANENGSTNYQVKLPEITVQTPDATENSMDNDTNNHTYMTGIETDGFGRVTKVITETMTENINCGTW